MPCPYCGDVCRCSSAGAPARAAAAQFDDARASVLVDPEGYEPSEEQFAASVAGGSARAAASPGASAETVAPALAAPARQTTLTGIERIASELGSNYANDFYRDGQWREEVASRLNSYRAKRRKRDPEGAMRLDFGGADEAPAAPQYRNAAVQRVAARYANRPPIEAEPVPEQMNVIQFPKPPLAIPEPPKPVERVRPLPPPPPPPMPPRDELAEAIPEKPRILDAPEFEEQLPIMPPVTAITLDGEGEEEAQPVAPGLELPLQAAPLAQRVFAGAVDGFVVLCASAAFGAVVVKIAGGMPASKLGAAMAFCVVGMLWALYQYLFLVYAGTTPGLEIAHLGMCSFEGEELGRMARRSRAIGIIIAALPLGLGFVWALLDEDMLCWHDRMSRSYVVEA